MRADGRQRLHVARTSAVSRLPSSTREAGCSCAARLRNWRTVRARPSGRRATSAGGPTRQVRRRHDGRARLGSSAHAHRVRPGQDVAHALALRVHHRADRRDHPERQPQLDDPSSARTNACRNTIGPTVVAHDPDADRRLAERPSPAQRVDRVGQHERDRDEEDDRRRSGRRPRTPSHRRRRPSTSAPTKTTAASTTRSSSAASSRDATDAA